MWQKQNFPSLKRLTDGGELVCARARVGKCINVVCTAGELDRAAQRDC